MEDYIDEYNEIVGALVRGMKRGGTIRLYEDRDDYDLIMSNRNDYNAFQHAKDIAGGLGLKMVNIPSAVNPEIYLFPEDGNSMFAMTRSDLEGKLRNIIPTDELRKSPKESIALFSIIFFHLVNVIFSPDLEPDCIKNPEMTLESYLKEFGAFLQKAAATADQLDDPSSSSIGAVARFYNAFPDSAADDLKEDRTRKSTKAGIVKSFLRFLASYDFLDEEQLKNGLIVPTGRFACFFTINLAATTKLADIQQLLDATRERY